MKNKDYIVIKGRAGLDYYDEISKKYELDSEMSCGTEYNYAIYVDNNIFGLEENEKKSILDRVMFLCKERGMTPKLFFPDENGVFK